MNRAIPVVAVEMVLYAAVRRGKRNIAAFTNDPRFCSTCKEIKRYGWPAEPAEPVHVGVISHGNLLTIAEKTHLMKSATEVRKTWGCGIRQLQAELA